MPKVQIPPHTPAMYWDPLEFRRSASDRIENRGKFFQYKKPSRPRSIARAQRIFVGPERIPEYLEFFLRNFYPMNARLERFEVPKELSEKKIVLA